MTGLWQRLTLIWERLWWTRYERYIEAIGGLDDGRVQSFDADWHLIHERHVIIADTVSIPGYFTAAVWKGKDAASASKVIRDPADPRFRARRLDEPVAMLDV